MSYSLGYSFSSLNGEVSVNGSPSSLVATVLSDTSIKLDWSIGSTNQDGHRIYYSTDGINYTLKGFVTGTTVTYTATGLTETTKYYFYVVAYKGSKESSDSNVVSGTTFLPSYSDLNLYIKSRSGLDLIESKQGLNGKILASTAKFNGTDNYLYNASGDYLIGGAAIDMIIKFYSTSKTGGRALVSYGGYAAASKGILIYTATTTGVLTITTANGTTMKTATFHTVSLNAPHVLRIQWSGITGETMTSTLDGVAMTSTETISWSGNSGVALSIGCNRPQSTPLNYFSGKIYEFQDGGHHFYFSGLGLYEHNASSTGYLKWYGTSGHSEYSSNASDYYLTSGYNIYKKTGQLDEYLPIGASSAFLISDGYALADYDTYEGDVNGINMYPCLIDFDPTGSGNSLLDTFNRSNTTIHSSLSRSASDYDSLHPYRYSIKNISDPRVYTEFLNVGYAGKLFGKITTQLSGGIYYIKSYKEQLSYTNDKTGNDQLRIMNYCGTNVFAL